VSASGSDGLLEFINGDTSGSVPILSVSNPVNWGKLGQSIGASILATVVVGVTNFVAAISDAITSILGGLTAFLTGFSVSLGSGEYPTVEAPGLIELTIGGIGAAYGSAFEFSSAQFGVLALPVNVGIVLGSVYVLSVGIQAAASRLFGGG